MPLAPSPRPRQGHEHEGAAQHPRVWVASARVVRLDILEEQYIDIERARAKPQPAQRPCSCSMRWHSRQQIRAESGRSRYTRPGSGTPAGPPVLGAGLVDARRRATAVAGRAASASRAAARTTAISQVGAEREERAAGAVSLTRRASPTRATPTGMATGGAGLVTATSRTSRRNGPTGVHDDGGEALEQLELAVLHDAAHQVDDPAVVDRAVEIVAVGAGKATGSSATSTTSVCPTARSSAVTPQRPRSSMPSTTMERRRVMRMRPGTARDSASRPGAPSGRRPRRGAPRNWGARRGRGRRRRPPRRRAPWSRPCR